MATTLEQLRDRVNEEIKIDPNNRVSSPTLIDNNLNEALRKVQQDLSFSLPENLKVALITANAQEKELPSDFQKIAQPDSLKLGDSTPISPTRYERILQSRNLTDTGQPYLYYIRWDGSNYVIGFYPSPRTSFTITVPYYAELPTMTDSQDSPLPSQYDIALIEYATYLTMRRLPMYEQKAIEHLSFYKESIKGIAANNAIRDASGYYFGYERYDDNYFYNPRGVGRDDYGF